LKSNTALFMILMKILIQAQKFIQIMKIMFIKIYEKLKQKVRVFTGLTKLKKVSIYDDEPE